MNRKKLILAGLLVVLIIAITTSYLRFPRQKNVDKLTFGPGSTAPVNSRKQSKRLPLPVSGNLRIDLLDAGVPAVTVNRDIFKPIFVDEERLRAETAMKKVKVVPPPPPTSKDIARKQIAQFKSLGMLKRSGIQTVFLARGEEIMLVRLGDKPIPGYQIIGITDESLYLRSNEGDDEIRFPLR